VQYERIARPGAQIISMQLAEAVGSYEYHKLKLCLLQTNATRAEKLPLFN